MTSIPRQLVVVGTGGTIAGTASRPDDSRGYVAAQLGVDSLLAGVPCPPGVAWRSEQLAQVDSKDMDAALWQRLARRLDALLADPAVDGIVVTHGTDTLEETAWFLQRVLAPGRPVVLTAAMRPATALGADGPRNLFDAATVAATPGLHGVLAVLAGTVQTAADLRKRHTARLDAFDGGDAGPLAAVAEGTVRRWREPPPAAPALGLDAIARDPANWPWVEVLTHHAGCDGRAVDALVAAGVDGLVVAGTGHGTLSSPLADALRRAAARGVPVVRASRCADGDVLALPGDDLPASGGRSPWQARVDLLLALLGRPPAA